MTDQFSWSFRVCHIQVHLYMTLRVLRHKSMYIWYWGINLCIYGYNYNIPVVIVVVLLLLPTGIIYTAPELIVVPPLPPAGDKFDAVATSEETPLFLFSGMELVPVPRINVNCRIHILLFTYYQLMLMPVAPRVVVRVDVLVSCFIIPLDFLTMSTRL